MNMVKEFALRFRAILQIEGQQVRLEACLGPF